jgi:hypothetical protein
MRLIEFIDTFREFSHKTLKSFLIEFHRLSRPIILCTDIKNAWIKWDLMHIRKEQAKRQNNCSGRRCWWSAKNIDYRDNTEKHFHSAPNKRRFCFGFASLCSTLGIFWFSARDSRRERRGNNEYKKKIKNNSTLPREKLLFHAKASFKTDFFLSWSLIWKLNNGNLNWRRKIMRKILRRGKCIN